MAVTLAPKAAWGWQINVSRRQKLEFLQCDSWDNRVFPFPTEHPVFRGIQKIISWASSTIPAWEGQAGRWGIQPIPMANSFFVLWGGKGLELGWCQARVTRWGADTPCFYTYSLSFCRALFRLVKATVLKQTSKRWMDELRCVKWMSTALVPENETLHIWQEHATSLSAAFFPSGRTCLEKHPHWLQSFNLSAREQPPTEHRVIPHRTIFVSCCSSYLQADVSLYHS